MRTIVCIWVFLLLLPWIVLIASYIPIFTVKTAIDDSFVVEPGGKKSFGYWYPYYECTRSAILTVEVTVEGGGINLTIAGGPSAPLVLNDTWPREGGIGSTYITHQYNFTIMPEENAWFEFDNTRGNSTVSVKFLLKEDLAKLLYADGIILGELGVFFEVPILVIGLVILLKKQARSEVEPIKAPKDPYEELLRVYMQSIGGRRALEKKIESLMKEGLNRYEAIYRLAEKEGLTLKE